MYLQYFCTDDFRTYSKYLLPLATMEYDKGHLFLLYECKSIFCHQYQFEYWFLEGLPSLCRLNLCNIEKETGLSRLKFARWAVLWYGASLVPAPTSSRDQPVSVLSCNYRKDLSLDNHLLMQYG